MIFQLSEFQDNTKICTNSKLYDCCYSVHRPQNNKPQRWNHFPSKPTGQQCEMCLLKQWGNPGRTFLIWCGACWEPSGNAGWAPGEAWRLEYLFSPWTPPRTGSPAAAARPWSPHPPPGSLTPCCRARSPGAPRTPRGRNHRRPSPRTPIARAHKRITARLPLSNTGTKFELKLCSGLPNLVPGDLLSLHVFTTTLTKDTSFNT